MNSKSKIYLNDILRLEDISNVKIRFNIMMDNNWNPLSLFANNSFDTLLQGQYWNYSSKKSFKEDQITLGFIPINRDENLWLLFHIGKVTKDLNIFDGVGYEYISLPEYQRYIGRLTIKFKNKSQNMVRLATSVISDCEVAQILPNSFDNDVFPGYDKVNISWGDLSRVAFKESWKTALVNQKGVYLITDINNGKMYIGSAYGENMLLGRWKEYIKTGHGGNTELRELGFDYIKKNFRYSILDIFKSTTDDRLIIERESWWKEVLITRKFGYNCN